MAPLVTQSPRKPCGGYRWNSPGALGNEASDTADALVFESKKASSFAMVGYVA